MAVGTPGKAPYPGNAKEVCWIMVKALKNPEKRICRFCGREYVPTRSWQKNCSIVCWQDQYNKEHDIAKMLREKRRKDKEAEQKAKS
jgi:hypothetical protein